MKDNKSMTEIVLKANEQFHDVFANYYDEMHQTDIFFPANQSRIFNNLKILSENSEKGVFVMETFIVQSFLFLC